MNDRVTKLLSDLTPELETVSKILFDAGKSGERLSNKVRELYYALKNIHTNPRIKYRKGVYSLTLLDVSDSLKDIHGLEILFTNRVKSKDYVEGIVKYWASLPFVGFVESDVSWINGVLRIKTDTATSSSTDWHKHHIVDLLLDYLENGTPMRKRTNTKAFVGLGINSVKLITANSN